jgi:hypothetical protein
VRACRVLRPTRRGKTTKASQLESRRGLSCENAWELGIRKGGEGRWGGLNDDRSLDLEVLG